jgi:aryl-alcohol dehydrogenase-like predicted oxidoreductase
MSLTQYRSLGRSGLAVSPLALGTMTFGTARWGSGPEVSRAVFDAYVEAGGNFIDTADVYASGRSEELLGSFIAERKLRDDLVIASKAGFASGSGVQRGGIGAKHLHAALEGSLRRLQTDYVDLYWVHVWDSITPATRGDHEHPHPIRESSLLGSVERAGLVRRTSRDAGLREGSPDAHRVAVFLLTREP